LARISFSRWRQVQDLLGVDFDVEAWPWKPPIGWWIMTRELGRQKRLPASPAARSSAPMLAACPTHSVLTSGLMNCMVS